MMTNKEFKYDTVLELYLIKGGGGGGGDNRVKIKRI